jgi:hypothetical protein
MLPRTGEAPGITVSVNGYVSAASNHASKMLWGDKVGALDVNGETVSLITMLR